MPNYFVLF
jgi:serine/threonine protein kinase